jgi:hypothetical protein
MTTDTTLTETDRAARADKQAVSLMARLDAATVLSVQTGTQRNVAARLRSTSIDSTTAEAVALADALAAVASGRLDVEHAVTVASRNACRDAIDRAATSSLRALSYDALDADAGTGLAALDGIGAARFSQYDEGSGIYRGVSRVVAPTDCLRADMPAPEEIASAVRDMLATPYRRALDACIGVNVAAESQRVAEIAAMTDYLARAASDAERAATSSRSGQVRLIRKAIKTETQNRRNARNADRSDANPYRPRAAETTIALGLKPTGRNRVATGEALDLASDAYWTLRETIAATVLAQHDDELSADAESQRQRYAMVTPRRADIGSLKTSTLCRALRDRIDQELRAAIEASNGRSRSILAMASRIPAPAQPIHSDALRGAGAGRYASSNGQQTPVGNRPRRMSTDQHVSAFGRPRAGSELATLAHADAVTAIARVKVSDEHVSPALPVARPTEAPVYVRADGSDRIASNGVRSHKASPEAATGATFEAIVAACGVDAGTFPALAQPMDWSASTADTHSLASVDYAATYGVWTGR